MQIQPITNTYFTNTNKRCDNSKQTFCGYISPINSEKLASTEKTIMALFSEQTNKPAAEFRERGALLLNLLHTMSGLEYISLPQGQKQVLRKITPDYIIDDAIDNYNIAHLLENYLNEHFGDINNCTLLCIGRSLASICETLKYMGHDVKFLPMTSMHNAKNYQFTPQQIKAYRDYLTSIGISRDIIQKHPNHKYITIDFTQTGESLENAHEFLKRPDVLGENSNLMTLSSNSIFGDEYNNIFIPRRLKHYSPVEQLFYNKFEDVAKAANPYKYPDYRFYAKCDTPIAKLFKFKVFEMLDKNNELKSL